MNKKQKLYIAGGILILIAFGVYVYNMFSQTQKPQTPLMGQAVKIQSSQHVPEGTQLEYNSNPPVGGQHYAKTTPAGFYDKSTPDGNLVHSMEHGAIILWHKSNLEKTDIDKLKNIFNKISATKKIMVPRNMDTPVALTSWGRILKLQKIDEKQIKSFFETNMERAPEQAPI